MSSLYPEPTPLVPRRPQPIDQPLVQPGRQPGRPSGLRPVLQPWSTSRSPDQRIGDAERSQVCEELSDHYAAGRLSDDELDARVSAAMEARTWGDLRPLVGDLPVSGSAQPAQVSAAPRSTPWSVLDVLALVALVGALGIALLGALMLFAAEGSAAYVVVAALSTLTAGVAGMAITQLLHRGHRSIVDRAVLRLRDDRPQG